MARRCSVKKIFLEISKSSEENTCIRDYPAGISGSKLTIETLEQGANNVFKVNNKDNGDVLVSLLLTMNTFHMLF